jgi:enoyl-CoA hydratase/carnithine racemase
MPEYQYWQLEDQARIAILRINRPDDSNSFIPESFYELRDITHRLNENKDVWAVIVEGNGDHFSIGIDVKVIHQMINLEEALFRKTLREMQECLDAFEALEKPTIAKLHGFCLGGGMILALCCDFRIASHRTVFGFPEVKRGVPVIMGSHRAVRVLGPGLSKEMMFLGRNLRAHTALEHGLVHQVVESELLDKKVEAFASKFLKLPPRTIGAAKRIINEGYPLSIRASQELEIEAQAELLDSPDFIEAISSHLENRSPNFIGE